METIAIPAINFAPIMPEVILSIFAMVLLLVNVFVPSEHKAYLGYLSLVGLIVAGFTLIGGWGVPLSAFNDSVVRDNFSIFFKGIFLLTVGMSILISDQYFKREECNLGELYPLLLFATVGMMLMASGTDLMTIFLGLEVLSVSLYILAGFNRANVKSNEAGLKYFLLGAFSTGFLLYGMALTYGATGTTRVVKIAEYVSQNGVVAQNPMFVIGMLLMAVGFSFKIAAAPFHMWTPDVYEGAPTPMTAFMSAGPKAAGFAAFMRVAIIAFPSLKADWSDLLWILAVLTMTIGNLIALNQDNIKRMLAYSSIAHAGYALVGFTAGNAEGTAGILFYMLSYAFMNIGAFAIIVLVGKKGEANNNVMDYAGFGTKHPVLALAMAVFLFSLAGMPPTAGFIGKFYLFSGAIKAGYVWLAIIGVLNSAASVYYYLRVMVYMYMKDPVEEFDWMKLTPAVAICIIIAVVGVLLPGVVPAFLLNLAQQAVLL
ncbi:NADH-quinone oxidoreductase subunit N [Geobacter hydrogenophilus]|uniref:NADH-quinone oxidoreductase subunit N n=1 Tax=Geobacter hydrogenophilus TaxID=40983 RepID=A0A9W6FZU7_9BACT|nr:NADH-quinone oxidoreductase subunit N [Geobacter hydrogenophilus]MBT0893469.1 NADH-quinone oxidoreductase subunit N [Geobacter hydrogenophilus]GLI37837.1 NADH-quinone oxidoreductase subunit N [Geobacter hydrogenophilus]